MTAELRRSLVLAGLGLVAGFGLVLALFGGGELMKRHLAPGEGSSPVAVAPENPAMENSASKPDAGGTKAVEEAAKIAPGKEADGKGAPGKPGLAGEQIPAPASPASTAAKAPPPLASPAEDPRAPTFDIIRVEPNGDTVIAGRGAPNTTVEMLRDGEPIARALIDPSGQFAIVPPALPPGSSEITLRITASDGQVRRSKESVAVEVSRNRDAKPLIALSAPDKPTVVLSQPEPAAAAPVRAAAAPAGGPRSGTAKPDPKAAAKTPEPPRAPPPPVKVVSVDAEEGGRLYVTGQAAPGATVRLYLNDTLVAPGSAGADGRLAFAIGKGVAPGAYRVRIDEVDSVSGKVKTRSEVAFAVPPPAPKPPSPVAALAPKDGGAGTREPIAVPQAKMSEAKTPATPPAQASPSVPDRDARVPAPDVPASGPHQAAARTEGSPAAMTPPTASAPVPAPSGAGAGRPDAPERTIFIPEIGTAKIIRGDNLWQISRRIYGRGTRYTVIFDANQSQIRNPDLIYPGQIFVLPTEGGAGKKAAEKRG